MKEASPLGLMIEEAIERDPRFTRHRDNIQYLCCFRAAGGSIFAFERVTKGHINFWIPEDERVKSAAEAAGLTITRSVPVSDPNEPDKYGRIHSLKSIPELREEPLYKVRVTTPGEALALLSALR